VRLEDRLHRRALDELVAGLARQLCNVSGVACRKVVDGQYLVPAREETV
jgi:hypothetical protein